MQNIHTFLKKNDLKERFPQLYLMMFIPATCAMLYCAHLWVGWVKTEESHEPVHEH